MKIKNIELMAKIASGQILPGICKDIQPAPTNTQPESKVEASPEEIERQRLIQNKLYNKYNKINVNNNLKNSDNTEEIKNKISHYLIKTREPSITALTDKELNLAFSNEMKEMQENIEKNQKAFQNKEKKQSTEKLLPVPNGKFAHESGSDIILKGTNIILGVNKCGLIGNSSQLSQSLQNEIGINNVGLLHNNLEYMAPFFTNGTQQLNFNCVKTMYKINTENKCVINSNLYETQNTKLNYLSNNNLNNYESLIPVNNYHICADDILSSETTGKSKDLSHAISYSFRKHDNSISVNITLTNTTKQTITDLKYYYAVNLNPANNKLNDVSHLKTSPYETGLFCTCSNVANTQGIYLRTKQINSRVFIDKEWDWLYGDKWDKVKLPEFMSIERRDLAISGLAFTKRQLKPQSSWSINFSIGFANEYEFTTEKFSMKTTGLKFSDANFSNKMLHNIITTCADFTNCDLSNADLSANSLEGAITGPLAINSGVPSKLPAGYKCMESGGRKYIIGPGVILVNANLSNVDFTGMNLSRANLSGANLSNGIFTQTNLSGVTMSVNFSNNAIKIPGYAVRDGIIFGPNLIYVKENFSGIDLSGLNLSGCVFSHCNFSSANISNCKFVNCKFEQIIPGPLEPNQVINVSLPSGYKLINLPKNKVGIAGPKVNFSDFDLTNSSIENTDLSEVNLSNTIMNGTNLTNSTLTNAITGPINSFGFNLRLPVDYKLVSSEASPEKYIVGPNIKLIGKDLTYFDFTNTNLTDGKFIFCDMSKSNLSNTNLSHACLPPVIGPLSKKSTNPINYQKTMSLQNLDGTKWLVYCWEHYKWDVISTQLQDAIYSN